MKISKLHLFILIVAVIFGLDQLTKWWVDQHMFIGEEIPVIPGFFDWVHYRNKGAAFGMLSGWDSVYRDWFFYLLSLVAMAFLIHLYRQIKLEHKFRIIPIAFILGGAFGNIFDRVFRGSVVDFIFFHWQNQWVQWQFGEYNLNFPLSWPAFNVADSAISVGVIWLLFIMQKIEN